MKRVAIQGEVGSYHDVASHCYFEGEDIELDATRILEKDLIDNDIPAWVDYWGMDVDHDWVWWKPQLRYFLPYVLDEINHR